MQIFDAPTGVALARATNDELAAAIAAHPTRYAGLPRSHRRIPARRPKSSSAACRARLERRDRQLAHARRVSRRPEVLGHLRRRRRARRARLHSSEHAVERHDQAVHGSRARRRRVRRCMLAAHPNRNSRPWQPSSSGTSSAAPIPIPPSCASRSSRRRRGWSCAGGPSCSGRSSRRSAGTIRRSTSSPPRAAICGAT